MRYVLLMFFSSKGLILFQKTILGQADDKQS